MRENLLIDKSVLFGVRIIKLYQYLIKTKKKLIVIDIYSAHTCHERNLFCLPRQERLFLAFGGKIQQKQVKLAQNTG